MFYYTAAVSRWTSGTAVPSSVRPLSGLRGCLFLPSSFKEGNKVFVE